MPIFQSGKLQLILKLSCELRTELGVSHHTRRFILKQHSFTELVLACYKLLQAED